MFKLIKIENGRMNVPSPVYYDVTASEAVTVGQGLKLNAGALTSCGATKPGFIALGNKSATDTARTLACIRVEPNQVYETTFSAIPTGRKVGEKVTLSAGTQVTATTTDGVATIVSLEGAKAAGDKVLVRFE
jgi:hypothetical protein